MLNAIGAIFIFCAGTMLGFYMSHQYMNRPRHIRQLHQLLQRLETEIAYGATPLAEALSSIGKRSAEPASTLCLKAVEELEKDAVTTAEAWSRAVEAVWHQTAMRNAEKEIILHLGRTLGASDRDDQIKHLRLTMSQLQQEKEVAFEEQRRYAKMWRSLGMLGGALIVILMY